MSGDLVTVWRVLLFKYSHLATVATRWCTTFWKSMQKGQNETSFEKGLKKFKSLINTISL